MKAEIKVPAMGESITEAVVGTILKPSESAVNMDDEILELETDKVNQVLYAPQTGKISYTVSKGDRVKIGQVIGYVDTEAKAAEPPFGGKKKEEPKEKAPSQAEIPVKSEEAGVRKSKEDFLKEIVLPAWPKPEIPKQMPVSEPEKPIGKEPAPIDSNERRETRRPMTNIRRVIAQRLVEAQHNAAMLTTFNEVDLSAVMELRAKYKDIFMKDFGAKLGFMSFFVKASVSALEAFPDVNSYISGEEIVHREYYDMGIAVGTERGLIVPVLRECNKRTFAEIEKAIENYAEKARRGVISLEDLQGGGFTITNGGIYGSLLSTPILNPPQSAILGMHKIEKRPVVINDEIVIRPMMYLAVSYDHRIIDGKEAVSFLVHIKNCLEDPSRLLLEV